MEWNEIKERCELFAKYNKQVFIRTVQNDYFFCTITIVTDDFVWVDSFGGKRKGMRDEILGIDIEEVSGYRGDDQNV